MFLNVFVITWYYHEIRRITSTLGMSSINLFANFRKVSIALATPYESDQVEMVSTLLSQFMKLTKGAGFICLYALITEIVSGGRKLSRILRSNILLIINIVLSALPSLMLAGRNDLMQLIASALVYYYIIWHRYHGWERNISRKYIKLGITMFIIGIPCFYGLLFLLGRSTTTPMFEYVSGYVGAPIVLFNDFLKNPVEEPQVFGEETLPGIHQLLHRLGLPTYVKNRHLEFRHLNALHYSNVYTFFRRPIHDFGLIGAYVFTALVSVLFAWLYYGWVRGNADGRKADFRIIIYGYLYYWIIYTSIDQRSISMISTGTIITFLIIYVELKIVTRVKVKFR